MRKQQFGRPSHARRRNKIAIRSTEPTPLLSTHARLGNRRFGQLLRDTATTSRNSATNVRAFVPNRHFADHDSAEYEAQTIAARVDRMPRTAIAPTLSASPSPVARAHRLPSPPESPGRSLPRDLLAKMNRQFDADFSDVRIHEDAAATKITKDFDARAVTCKNDIYFDNGQYDPGSAKGRRLLTHELTHVQQQKSGNCPAVQCDLMQSIQTLHGGFDINMATLTFPPTAGMSGTIQFLPAPTAPYSAQIGLIQAVNVTDVTAGGPEDYSGWPEAPRNTARTTGRGLAEEGWFIDDLYAGTLPGDTRDPNYITPAPAHGPNPWGQFGWVRSPTDTGPATLDDAPGIDDGGSQQDLDFETVAKATDTQAVYGALHWGFGIRGPNVVGEYARAENAASIEFDEALERYRGYFAHEDIVVYFETNDPQPRAGEQFKIDQVVAYYQDYPDMQVDIIGYADSRGSVQLNLNLAHNRANSVAQLLLSSGLPPSAIGTVDGRGRTSAFAAGASTGQLLANRRVVISLRRNQTSPMPPIAGP